MSEPTPARIGAAPTEPSTAYMAQLDEEREVALRTQSHPGSDHEGAPAALLSRLEEEIDRLGPELVETMIDLAEHPEVAFEEHRSAAAIVAVLAAHGIEAQLGVHGLDTAIRAEIRGTGADDAPTVAVLSEYDALPGVGHGCGHNVIAVMGLGAFLGLAELAKKDPAAVPGTVVYLGTPAEEGHKIGRAHV